MAEPSETPERAHDTSPDVTPGVRCVKCGRSLSGVSYKAKCPGCGARASKSLGSPDRKPDSRCLFCTYDLRGLRNAEVCPECGTSIELARLGTLLPRARARSLRAARLGATLACAALLMLFLFPIASMLVGFLLSLAAVSTPVRWGSAAEVVIVGGMLISAVAGAAMWSAGWLLFAGATRDEHLAGTPGLPAKVTVWATVVFAGAAAVVGALLVIESVLTLPSPSVIVQVLSIVLTISGVVGALAGLVLCGRVIGNTTNKAAKKRVKGLYWTLPLLGIGLLPMFAPHGSMLGGVWQYTSCFSILLIVWPVYYASMLWLTRGELGRALAIKSNLGPAAAAETPPAGTLG